MGIYYVNQWEMHGLNKEVVRLGPDTETPESMRTALEELSRWFVWDTEAERRAFVEEYSWWETLWVCKDPFAHECSYEARPLVAQTEYELEVLYLNGLDNI